MMDMKVVRDCTHDELLISLACSRYQISPLTRRSAPY